MPAPATEPFDLTTAVALHHGGTSPAAIAEHLSMNGSPVSPDTVRRRLLDASALIPEPGTPVTRCVIRVKGLLHDGWGYAACRCYNQTFRDGYWMSAKGARKTVAVCWRACVQTTPLTSAAVGGLLGLLHIPPGVMTRILAADEDVLGLLRQHRDTPQFSPLPAHPADVLKSQLAPLRQATLGKDTKADKWSIPAEETDRLDGAWASLKRRAVLKAARHMQSHEEHQEPQPGSWIADFGSCGPKGGAAAFYRYTRLPLVLTPVTVVPLVCVNPMEGEIMATLLAHAWARMSGEERPVIHNDCQSIQRRLQRVASDGQIKCSSNLQALFDQFPAQEIRSLDLRWTRREHDAIAHAAKAARAHLTSADADTTGLRQRCAHVHYGTVIAAMRAFFQEHHRT